jgi:hypothetical protein
LSTGTATRPATQTISLTKIVYVTRKVQADFLAIMDTYGYFSEDYAKKLIADVRTFLDEDVIDAVKFIWKEAGTNDVLEELRYVVISGSIGLADDRPGGIRYNAALKNADFTVYVTYNDRWKNMNEQEKQAVRDSLQLSWGPGGTLNYSQGYWQTDKIYSSGDYGLSRRRFTRYGCRFSHSACWPKRRAVWPPSPWGAHACHGG